MIQQSVEESRAMLDEIYSNQEIVGRIFKVSDFYLLRATCLMLERKFEEAAEAFTISLKEKISETNRLYSTSTEYQLVCQSHIFV